MQDRLERVLDELVQLTPGAHDLASLASDAIVVERPAVALAVGLRDFRGCGHACHTGVLHARSRRGWHLWRVDADRGRHRRRSVSAPRPSLTASRGRPSSRVPRECSAVVLVTTQLPRVRYTDLRCQA
jgi:hypothetical protein